MQHTRISIHTVAEEEGFNNDTELLLNYGMESVVPACCSEGCKVEPDGHCPHGNPSILLATGII